MTLVVSSNDSADRSLALVNDEGEVEVPTYRLANERSPYDETQARLWFYTTRALKIQRAWRLRRDLRRFEEHRRLVLRVRAERVAAYYKRRMQRLLHYIAWDGQTCCDAATTIQRAFRKRYFPQKGGALVPVEENKYIWEL